MKNKFNLKNVTIQTWARTIVLAIALISELLVIIGKRTEALDVDKLTEYATYALTVIASVSAWWKNNSFTAKAQEADKFLHGKDDSDV